MDWLATILVSVIMLDCAGVGQVEYLESRVTSSYDVPGGDLRDQVAVLYENGWRQ